MHDVVTVGEAMLRLWVSPGERLETAAHFRVAVAGAEANVAIALARLGHTVAWLSRLPSNALGYRVVREIGRHGVDTSKVEWVEEARVGTYFVELSVPPRPTGIVYDRSASAAAALTVTDIDWSLVAEATLVYVSGITPALSVGCRDVARRLLGEAASAGIPGVLDVNYRQKLWGRVEARETLLELSRLASIVITTEEDARDVFEIAGDSAVVLERFAELTGAGQVVVTRGAEGAVWWDGGSTGRAPGFDVETIDRIGAGDAFTAGVISGVLGGSLAEGVELGLAMAALKLGLHGDQLIADRADIDAIREGTGRDVNR